MNGVTGALHDEQIDTDREQLPEIIRLYRSRGFRLLTMVGTDERRERGQFALYWVLGSDVGHCTVHIRTDIPSHDPTFPSVTPILPSANWYEREVRDLLGLTPIGHPDPRPLILHGEWAEKGRPLHKDFNAMNRPAAVVPMDEPTLYEGEGIVEVPVGPIHAGIIEPGHFRFGVLGDVMLHLDTRLFYTHRGLEKKAEGLTIEEGLALAERACGVCALSHSAAFCQAVERLAGIVIPERAEWLRVLFLELERMYNHIGDIGNLCAGVGFSFGAQHGARLKERLLRFNELLSGHRYLRGVMKPGGLRMNTGGRALYHLSVELGAWMNDFRQVIEVILSHDGTMERMADTGKLRYEDAVDLDVVGPAARASGLSRDMRRNFPYGVYGQTDFHIPVYKDGDVLSRFRVRMDELEQSYRLIRQVVEKVKEGEAAVPLPPIEEGRSGIGYVESPRGDTIHWLMIGPDNRIFRYRIRSASYANWPAVPFTVQGNIIPDFPLINKSFELCYACCDR